MARYLYSELASAVQARRNCAEHNNTEWFEKWTDYIESMQSHLPHGSGFDCGTKIDLDASHAEKLVFTTSFHHMNDAGMYDGWTDHIVTVTPSFSGFNLRVSGRNRNDIKEYIAEEFHNCLRLECEMNDQGLATITFS